MSEYFTPKRQVLRYLLALILVTVMALTMLIPSAYAGVNDLTANGYGISTSGKSISGGWTPGNLGKTYQEGEWVPFQTVVTNIDWAVLENLGAAFDFYDDGRFYDLVRNISVSTTPLTDADGFGFPNSEGEPWVISDLEDLDDAQREPNEYYFDGFAPIVLTESEYMAQINKSLSGGTGTETDMVRVFFVTRDQLLEALGFGPYNPANIGDYPTEVALYFQLHLSRTFIWNNTATFENVGELPLAYVYTQFPTDKWGGYVYDEDFLNSTMFGSYIYPGSSGHSYAYINNGDGGEKTIPIPDVDRETGKISGYKYRDVNANGIYEPAIDTPLSGWDIFLRTDLYAIPDVEFKDTTDVNGFFEFTDLPYNLLWELSESMQAGYSQTYPNDSTTGESDLTGSAYTNWWKLPLDLVNDADNYDELGRGDYGWEVKLSTTHTTQTNVNFMNTNTGDLEITKLFDYEGVEGFTDEMLPASIDIHITGPSFLPDGEDFSLLKTENYVLLLEDLLPGDYSITEVDVPMGWEGPDVPINVSVIAGDIVEIDFTNVFLTGSLKITKEFDFEGIFGFDEETMLPAEITVEVTGPSYPDGTEVDITISDEGIGEVTLNNLIPGNYTVAELAFTGSEMWDSDIDPESVEVVGGALEAVVVSITNTFMPGELRITKDFDFAGIFGFDGATMLPDSITVEVTGPSYPTGTEVTINIDDLGDGTALLQNLIPGDYTIEELDFTGSDAWDSDIDPEMVEVIAGANPVVEVMITNTFIPGELRITKVFDFEGIEGFDADTMLPASISVKVTGASYPLGTVVNIDIDEFGEGETLLDNLIPDDYTVEELTFEGSEAWDSAIVGSPATVVGGAVTAVKVEITNTFEPGELKITKAFDFEGIVGFDPETMLPDEITVMVTGNSYPLGMEVDIPISELGVGEVTIGNLIPGDYTVDELEFTGSDMWASSINGSPAAVLAGAEPIVTVAITNTFIPGDLEITKFFDYEGVVGFEVSMLPDSIDIHITGPSYDPNGLDVTLYKTEDYYVKLENLIPGDYSIDEITVGDEWEAPELPISEEVLADGLVSISFTNVYVPGDLEITKLFDYEGVVGFDETMLPETIDIHIEGPSYDPDGLDVTLEKEFDYYVKLENLLPGTYEITEIDVPSGWMAPSLPIEVEVENGETASVEFTNVFMTGSLMITKNFVGGDETIWPEEIVVVVTGPSYLLGFEAVIEIDQVTGSGSVTLDDLIPGEYTFTELAFVGSENFSSNISPQSVMVVAGSESPAMVTITNTMAYHDETAWALGDNENWDSVKSNNWGWNIGPITDGYSETHDLIAGAGGNIVENGTLVGHVEIVYSGGYVTVTYHMLDGFELMDTHVWIGTSNLPKLKNGKMTDSPGQFPYEDGVSIAVSGPVYVAAHAVVRMPGN